MGLNPNRFLQDYLAKFSEGVLIRFGFKSFYHTTSIASHHIYSHTGKGQLPPLVILHGGGDSAEAYLPLLIKLRKQFKEIIVVEAPGHGLSGEPQMPYIFADHYQTMTEVLDHFIRPEEPAIIMGHSLGGMTAFHYTHHSPERVKKLFLLSSMGAPMSKASLDDLYAAFRITTLKEAEVFMKRMLHEVPFLKSGFVKRLVLAQMKRQAIQSLVEATTTKEGVPAEWLRQIRVPTMIIYGKSDRIATSNSIDFFSQNLANVVIREPVNIGHCPHLENPKYVLSQLLEFSRGEN